MITGSKRDTLSPEKSSLGGTDRDLDMDASHFDAGVADTELRKRFRQEAIACMQQKGFSEQRRIFMECIQFICTLVTSQMTELFLKRRHLYEMEKQSIDEQIARGDYWLDNVTERTRRIDYDI